MNTKSFGESVYISIFLLLDNVIVIPLVMAFISLLNCSDKTFFVCHDEKENTIWVIKHKRYTVYYQVFYYRVFDNIYFHKTSDNYFVSMFQISTIVIFWLFLLMNNGENFKLTGNTHLSRLRKQTHEQKASRPATRQVRRCYTGCDWEFSFNDSLSLPPNCNETETNYACEMLVLVDYTRQRLVYDSYLGEESLTVDNITYDSLAEHVALIGYPGGLKDHLFLLCLCYW